MSEEEKLKGEENSLWRGKTDSPKLNKRRRG